MICISGKARNLPLNFITERASSLMTTYNTGDIGIADIMKAVISSSRRTKIIPGEKK